MPFGDYKDFQSCILANKNKKNPEGYCAALHRKILGRWPSQKESYIDPLIVDQPSNSKLPLFLSYHVVDPMQEKERKSILFDILRCQQQNKQDVFDDLWNEIGFEYIEFTEAEIPQVENNQDMLVYLTDTAPKLNDVDISRIVFRCSSHIDLSIKLSEQKYINWELCPDLLVIQYIESGNIHYPVRNKFLENKVSDIITSDQGYITNKIENDHIIEGEIALGVSTNNMHEYFIWLANKPLSDNSDISISINEGGFIENTYKIINVNSKQGVKAVVGKLKSSSSVCVQKYLFSKEYDWDIEKAKSWVNSSGKKIINISENLSGRWIMSALDSGGWILTHSFMFSAPYILNISEFTEDIKSIMEAEGVSQISFSPEVIPILESDELGKIWLSHIPETLRKSVYNKYKVEEVKQEEIITTPIPWVITLHPQTSSSGHSNWIINADSYLHNNKKQYTAIYNPLNNSIEISEKNSYE